MRGIQLIRWAYSRKINGCTHGCEPFKRISVVTRLLGGEERYCSGGRGMNLKRYYLFTL